MDNLQQVTCIGYATLKWTDEHKLRVELIMFDTCITRRANMADYEKLIRKFGGRYNKKTHTATINCDGFLEVEHFIRYDYFPNCNIMTMLE